MAADATHIERFVRKLRLLGELEMDDRAAIASLPFALQHVGSRRTLVHEGEVTSRCCLLVEGYACRHRTTSEGKRQIVAFHLPGDLMDLQHILLPRADHTLEMISPGTVAWLPVDDLRSLVAGNRRVAEAFAKNALVEASISREWLINIGRRSAKARTAHVLCEFAARRNAVGISSVKSTGLPMTQGQIGDAAGLTPVHVNRMLRVLSEEGALSRKGQTYAISDWFKLKSVAGFDKAYLHGTGSVRIG